MRLTPSSSMRCSAARSAGRLPWMSVITATSVAVIWRAPAAGADDRRAGVLVHAVGRADLDVDQAGGGERRAELVLGERAGDAAGPLRHGGLGGVVHVRVGDDVGDGEPAVGLQHARRLAEHPELVAGEVDDAVEMTTSTDASGSGMSSMWPLTNCTFDTPAAVALARAR